MLFYNLVGNFILIFFLRSTGFLFGCSLVGKNVIELLILKKVHEKNVIELLILKRFTNQQVLHFFLTNLVRLIFSMVRDFK